MESRITGRQWPRRLWLLGFVIVEGLALWQGFAAALPG
jgi:hypothetical protein